MGNLTANQLGSNVLPQFVEQLVVAGTEALLVFATLGVGGILPFGLDAMAEKVNVVNGQVFIVP